VGYKLNRFGVRFMKDFESLFRELKDKAQRGDPESGTVKMLAKGKHAIGKKLIEEAGEVWMASRYEGKEAAAEEISQLLYHAQVMILANELELEDVYRYL
jgi:phosphoribosyl-ATP pyrophosphohydrolase